MNVMNPGAFTRQLLWAAVVLASIGWPVSMQAAEPEVCESYLASIDQRIGSGKYPENNVALARQLRDALAQSCSHLPEDQVAQMMEGFEQLLPTRTEEERLAYEKAKREQRRTEVEASRAENDARRAERDRRRQAQAEEEERNRLPVSPVLTQPPTARVASIEHIERPDGMSQVEIIDSDVYEDSMRILYRSYPAHAQEGDPTAAVHFYLVLAKTDGSFTQHKIATYPFDGLVKGGLRRGHAEAVFQVPGELRPAPQSTLERRALPDGNLLSSSALPELGWTETGWGQSLFFRALLEDGNLLFAGNPRDGGPAQCPATENGNSLVWSRVTPSGNVMRQGCYAVESTNTVVTDVLAHSGGNVTFLVNASLADRSSTGIPTQVPTPIKVSVGTAEIEGYVHSENRLVSVDGSSGNAQASAGFGQVFDWKGQASAFAGVSMAQIEDANARRLVAEKSYGTGTRKRSGLIDIKTRAGLLVNVHHDPAPDRQKDGIWLREYENGEIIARTHLQSAAEHLNIDFQAAAAYSDDIVYVYGSSSRDKKGYVIKLSADREITAYAETSFIRDYDLAGLQADGSGVWILWRQQVNQGTQMPVLEWIDFSH